MSRNPESYSTQELEAIPSHYSTTPASHVDTVSPAPPQPIHAQPPTVHTQTVSEKTQPQPESTRAQPQQQQQPQQRQQRQNFHWEPQLPPNQTAPHLGGGTLPYAIPLAALPDQSQPVDCPFCGNRAMTRVQTEDSGTTMCAGAVLCLVCILLAFLPCMMGFAQNVDHYCSVCRKKLTHRHHDGQVEVTEAAQTALQRRLQEQPAPPYQREEQPQYQQQQQQQQQQYQGPPQQTPSSPLPTQQQPRDQVWG